MIAIFWAFVLAAVALFVGFCLGVLIMAMCNLASDSDAHIDRMERGE